MESKNFKSNVISISDVDKNVEKCPIKKQNPVKNEIRLISELNLIERESNFDNIISFESPKYKVDQETKEIMMFIEFIDFFKIKIIFGAKYPFIYPKVTFYDGKFIDSIFTSSGNVKLDFLSSERWKPTMNLNIILYSINELLSYWLSITNKNDIFNYKSKNKYGKRKWKEYIKESKKFYNDCLEKNKFNVNIKKKHINNKD